MSHRQTSLPNSEAPFWALSEIQNDSMVLEQSSGSFHPVVTDIEMEDLVAEMTCVSVGAQSCFMSAESETVTSSSKPEEGFAGQAVANSSGPSKTIVNISAVLPDDIDRKIALLVKLMVLKYQVKQSLTRKEIAEIVIREHGDHFDEIFFRACLRLEMIFGLEVKEMDPSIHSYVLVTKLGLTFDGMLCGEEGIPKTGILILVLGLIFLKGNSATEQEIWQVLNLIGIHTDERHFIFGDTKELITKDFVREKYLMCQKVPDSSSEQLKYLWGPRAHAETTKMKVLEFMAKIHGSDPSDFGHWYEDALQDEAERAGSSTSSY